MLRSVGYFSGIECPSEGEKDGCRRPYCPFRHQVKKDHSSKQEYVAGTITIDAVNDAIEKLKSGMAEECDRTFGAADSGIALYNNPMLNESYTPEHYSSASEPNTSANLYKPSKAQPNHSIEYYPSKNNKSVLHGARGPTKNICYSTSVSQKGSINYKSNIHNQPITDMEYDPVVNYSTSVSKSFNASNALSKRNYTGHDNIGIPSKKSKIEIESSLSNPFSSAEEDDDGLVISEEQEGTNSSPVLNSTSCESDHMSCISSDSTGEDTSELKDDKMKMDESNSNTSNVMSYISSFNVASNESNERIKNTQPRKSSSSKKRSVEKHDFDILKLRQNKEKLNSKVKVKSKKKPLQSVKRKDASDKNTVEKKTVGKKPKGKRSVTPKDIDVTDIKSLVGKDEIKRLEDELESVDHYEECLRIYHEGVEENEGSNESCESSGNEQSTTALVSSQEVKSAVVSNETSNEIGPSKRRIAHVNASSSATSLRKPSGARKRISTPAQMMMKRLEIIEQEKNGSVINKTSGRVAHKLGGRMSTLAKVALQNKVNRQKKSVNLEKKIQDNSWYPDAANEPTVCGTATKGVARVAHKANSTIGEVNNSISGTPPRPRISIERHSKVPNNIRQRYLTTFIDECLRICNNHHEKAYAMAQAEEENCKKRSSTKNIYLSLAASSLKRLRESPASKTMQNSNSETEKKSTSTKTQQNSNSIKVGKSAKVMSHGRLLDTNTKRCEGGYTIGKREEKSQLSPTDLYEKMCSYIMTPGQLDLNGYPRPSDVPGKAEFRSDPPPKPFNNTNKKTCAHCGKEFFLDKKGRFAREEECTHHWGRAYMTRVGRGWEKRYSCCQERIGSEGCTIGDTHVHSDNKLDRSGFVKTLMKSPTPDGNAGIFTLDCEMSYTVNGLELTRVSVLDCDCKLVYDTMVKPSGRVLDYNTRWSGIKEEDMKNVKTTIRDVQAVFLTKFSADTILMGHSLDSDLIALRIIHETVVDTSLVFPHKRGFPYKRALRNITSEVLGLVIQNMASEGHDSTEDAAACMKLMMWKVAEDCKLSQK